MKKNMLEKIKISLLKEKQELLAKSAQNITEVDCDGDETDEIQASLIVSLNAQLANRDMAKINKINFALRKIEEGSFGTCEECEEPIADRRLEINPCFTTCVKCAEKQEFKNSQYRKN